MTLFGAPNVLRGRNQSGALSSRDAIAEGVAEALCSDYAPQALVFLSGPPTRATELADRGEIALGLRAPI